MNIVYYLIRRNGSQFARTTNHRTAMTLWGNYTRRHGLDSIRISVRLES